MNYRFLYRVLLMQFILTGGVAARSVVTVNSLAELRKAVAASNQQITMSPGVYEVNDLQDDTTGFLFGGSNNIFELKGVTIRMPVELLGSMARRGTHKRAVYKIYGGNITIRGGRFENTYADGMTDVEDFGLYNRSPKYHPAGALTEFDVGGDDVVLSGCKVIVRGSFPYGYGNMYGIGGGAAVNLKKHCGIRISGDRVRIESCAIKMEAFGHAIFVQGGDQTHIKDSYILGGVRCSNECYLEKHKDDLPNRFNYQIQWPEEVKGLPIPKDHMLNLAEDGIRAYGNGRKLDGRTAKTGHMSVENCKVVKMRGGIKLYMGQSASVVNCEALDCVVQGYSLPSKGVIRNCRGNAAYGPLLYVHGDNHNSQNIEIELLPSAQELGDHPLAAIKGRNHKIRIFQKNPQKPKIPRPIIIGYPLRFDFLSTDYPDPPPGYQERYNQYAPETYVAREIQLENRTLHPVIIGEKASDNTIFSIGPVKGAGVGNKVTFLNDISEK